MSQCQAVVCAAVRGNVLCGMKKDISYNCTSDLHVLVPQLLEFVCRPTDMCLQDSASKLTSQVKITKQGQSDWTHAEVETLSMLSIVAN